MIPEYDYTPEEMEEARKLYDAECAKDYANGYTGDFGCGLRFAMATYSVECWAHFFKRPPRVKN